MLNSTSRARRPSRGLHAPCVLAAVGSGEEHPAGWQSDFPNDDGNLVADLEAFCRTRRRAPVDLPERHQPQDPIPYGECEMRRHDKTRPTGERWLLRAYWAVSGYGLRATRALVWLGAAMAITVAALMLWGLPNNEPKQEASGTVPTGGGAVTFEIDKDDPQNPTGDKFTGKRFEKALNVTLNSVIFRSSGQDLTTAGTYIEMGSRLAEPILLGLAVLAVRNRVKR